MTKAIPNSTKAPLEDHEVALCQRVLHRLSEKEAMDAGDLDDLACLVLHLYQDGVRSEAALEYLLTPVPKLA
ncbi:hypothetical protein FZ934_11690 [Rhizobium grahamii]|uniref:Uncharacterized protein n=1 Tax=Rhizobium grahamii TaxID=1120045 RepID=A0A5Q0C530_9HYPH|nr:MULTISPECIES: hypothetical protein [Rhizobium]QFY61016.1 hypothetical protein FZ934_11690 [Rhizobium grahamii]QRM49834.1 hypothetical protein F3Y33_11200 [Rhizobium sp. BG6]